MKRQSRQSGYLMLELVIALGVLAVGLFSFLSSYFYNFKATNTLRDLDEAQIALENATEQLRGAVFEEVYASYHGTTITVPTLKGADGGPADIQIEGFVDEYTIPPAFGVLDDINGTLTPKSADCSGDYRLLPVRLTLSFMTAEGVQTEEVHVVLGSD